MFISFEYGLIPGCFIKLFASEILSVLVLRGAVFINLKCFPEGLRSGVV